MMRTPKQTESYRPAWLSMLTSFSLLIASCTSNTAERLPVNEPSEATPTTAERSAIQKALETPTPDREATTFTFDAPADSDVTLELTANFWQAKPEDEILLTPDGDTHSVTLYLGSGQWLYYFRVDGGGRQHDPANPDQVPSGVDGDFYSRVRIGEQPEFSTPAAPEDSGQLIATTIESYATRSDQPLHIYLPPKYRSDQKYPLVVLLHGFGQGSTEWSSSVELQNYLDNMIAANKIEPMVVVMPETGSSLTEGIYEKHIIEEVLPYITSNYSIESDPSQRVVGGISAGGYGAFYLGWNYPEQFGLAVPIMMASNCLPSGKCTKEQLELKFPDKSTTEFLFYTGHDDELGFTTNQENVSELLDKRGNSYNATVSKIEGHKRSGHSVRYVRSILPDILIDIDQYFQR